MEENKKSNSKVTIITIVVLSIMVIAMGVYIVYMSLNKQSNEKMHEIENQKINNNLTHTSDTMQNIVNSVSEKIENKKVTKVESKQINKKENTYKLIFYGKDSNNKTIWTYETIEGALTEVELIENLKVTDDRVYINEGGTIVVLNKETGKVIWKNKEYKGATSEFCFDDKGTLYISGYYEPLLCIIDKDGNTVKIIRTLDDYCWTDKVSLRNENELEIECTDMNENEEIVLVINLNDYSKKVEKK